MKFVGDLKKSPSWLVATFVTIAICFLTTSIHRRDMPTIPEEFLDTSLSATAMTVSVAASNKNNTTHHTTTSTGKAAYQPKESSLQQAARSADHDMQDAARKITNTQQGFQQVRNGTKPNTDVDMDDVDDRSLKRKHLSPQRKLAQSTTPTGTPGRTGNGNYYSALSEPATTPAITSPPQQKRQDTADGPHGLSSSSSSPKPKAGSLKDPPPPSR